MDLDNTEQREFERFPLMIEGMATVADDDHKCVLMNISAGGAKIQLTDLPPGYQIHEGSAISLIMDSFGGLDGVVAWADDEYLGIRFNENHKAISALVAASA